MSQAITEAPTGQYYEPPMTVQFSVFSDNRVGRLVDLLEVFKGQPVRLAGFSVVDSADHAVVRLVSSKSVLTRRLLNRHGHAFSEIDVVAVELAKEGDFLKACEALLQAELSVHYAYPLLVRPRGLPVVALQTDDIVMAGQILRRRHFNVLAENDLGDNAPGSRPGDDTPPGLPSGY